VSAEKRKEERPMNLNDLPPFLTMSDIVSFREGRNDKNRVVRQGLVPFGRSLWLKYRKAGKIPQGRQIGATNTAVLYTREEVLSVIEMIKNGELAL
jgi:activator of HSP90 ATPase